MFETSRAVLARCLRAKVRTVYDCRNGQSRVRSLLAVALNDEDGGAGVCFPLAAWNQAYRPEPTKVLTCVRVYNNVNSISKTNLDTYLVYTYVYNTSLPAMTGRTHMTRSICTYIYIRQVAQGNKALSDTKKNDARITPLTLAESAPHAGQATKHNF